jgi:Phosphotransferase enzyme family
MGRIHADHPRFCGSLPARDQFQAAVVYGQAQYGFSAQATTRLLEMYDQRQWYLDALDHLPSTLCHGDADRRNFLAHQMVDGEEELIAIDWAWIGSGVVGQDASRLVNNAISFGQIAPAELRALDTIVFTNYLHGLKEAGWQADPRLVRLGYAASMILVESLVFLSGLFVLLMDPNSHAFIIQIVGGSIDDILARARALLAFYVELADEAQAIWATLRS